MYAYANDEEGKKAEYIALAVFTAVILAIVCYYAYRVGVPDSEMEFFDNNMGTFLGCYIVGPILVVGLFFLLLHVVGTKVAPQPCSCKTRTGGRSTQCKCNDNCGIFCDCNCDCSKKYTPIGIAIGLGLPAMVGAFYFLSSYMKLLQQTQSLRTPSVSR
ncbi:uncharacterized protein BXIN_2572 [Babesia sp. Xinjiang]|uniref:uncharacterized protein n=1 Tax=Babesia sp. Xinjiang TaxID=462227 RepID=UPI000A256C0B|nr:uncharacterized protein BXIN_2572 [Babesia sp. Xinjiang]ORM41418.1 hypothetical protein BXIN_2572 [Babesia sp. Xinjiang]